MKKSLITKLTGGAKLENGASLKEALILNLEFEKTDPLKAKAEFPPEEDADPDIPLKLDPRVAKAKERAVALKLKKSP